MAKVSYELVLVEEKAIARVQAMALRLLAAKKISRVQLAEAMGCSQAHISQLLGDEPRNLTIRKAARLFHHLGEQLVFSCDAIDHMNKEAEATNARKASALEHHAKSFAWHGNVNANGNEPWDLAGAQRPEQVAA